MLAANHDVAGERAVVLDASNASTARHEGVVGFFFDPRVFRGRESEGKRDEGGNQRHQGGGGVGEMHVGLFVVWLVSDTQAALVV